MNHIRATIAPHLLITLSASAICTHGTQAEPLKGGRTMHLTSPAIPQGKPIPRQYTCDGSDLSPPLQWDEPPQGTRSFALIADDPDAPSGTFVHWVFFNLPPETRALPGGLPPDARLADGTVHGKNSWGNNRYGGPCPPGGSHRYFFKLYALDTMLDLPAGASKEQLLRAMQGHILAETELMGVYARR